MAYALDIASWILFIVGGVFVFVGGVGALRLPDLYTRMHAAGLTDSMGTIAILLATVLQAGSGLDAAKLVAILVFLMLTGPTATYALANAARLSPNGADPARVQGDDS